MCLTHVSAALVRRMRPAHASGGKGLWMSVRSVRMPAGSWHWLCSTGTQAADAQLDSDQSRSVDCKAQPADTHSAYGCRQVQVRATAASRPILR
eukprot:365987-Chlamydomonas_euryale.AAC.17